MKKLFLVMALAIVCKTNYAQEKLIIDTSKSELKWSGEYTFYFGGHDGTISIKEGYFIKTNDVISGGEFIIDMTTIICNDIEEVDTNKGLVEHLESEDFFNIKKFPKAKLVFTKIEYHNKAQMRIEADLTLKGITKPINFQAEVNYETQQMSSKFKIDRKEWNVNYTSKFKDGAISDGIGFEVLLSL